MKPSRQTILGMAIFILSTILSIQQTIGAVAPGYADWFGYDNSVSPSWIFSAVEADPYQVIIHRKGTRPGEADRRVFVFYPRPSSAYNTAITSILNVFDEKNIDAEFTVFNFRKNDERGQLGLAMAAKWGAELIFSMGSESTAWLYKSYQGGDISVVSVCSKDPVALGQIGSYDQGSGTNFAFTSLNMPVESQMAYILELKPNLKNLGILVNNKNIRTSPMSVRRWKNLVGSGVGRRRPPSIKWRICVMAPLTCAIAWSIWLRASLGLFFALAFGPKRFGDLQRRGTEGRFLSAHRAVLCFSPRRPSGRPAPPSLVIPNLSLHSSRVLKPVLSRCRRKPQHPAFPGAHAPRTALQYGAYPLRGSKPLFAPCSLRASPTQAFSTPC